MRNRLPQDPSTFNQHPTMPLQCQTGNSGRSSASGNNVSNQQVAKKPRLPPGVFGTGTRAGSKSVYATSRALCPCCVVWSEKKPGDNFVKWTEWTGTESNNDSYAFVKGYYPAGEWDYPTREKGWVLNTVWINNKEMMKLLAKVFRNWPELGNEAQYMTFTWPFAPFTQFWNQYEKARVDEHQSSDTFYEFTLCMAEAKREPGSSIFTVGRAQELTFDDLLSVFIPGKSILSHTADGEMFAGVLHSVERFVHPRDGSDCCRFEMAHLDWDGSRYGVVKSTYAIKFFPGTRRLTSLKMIPFPYMSDFHERKDRLTARGRKFEALRGQRYVPYCGRARLWDVSEGRGQWGPPITLHERVRIDAKGYFDSAICPPTPLDPFHELMGRLPNEEDGKVYSMNCTECFSNNTLEPTPDLENSEPDGGPLPAFTMKNEPDCGPLRDNKYMLTPPTLYGFAMQAKQWCKVEIDSIPDIEDTGETE